jgi:hypothetical protein
MKGHNFDHCKGDICKKCGKIHLNPMQGKHHSIRTRFQISKTHYMNLGINKRQVDKAARFITQDQPKSPNIAANTESQTSS